MKCHSTNTNRSSNYNNINSNIDKGYCNHNHFIGSMFYYLRNHNHVNDYHNHCNHKNYPNHDSNNSHKPLHGISRLLTSPTGTMNRFILCLCFMLTLNYIINILNPHYSYADTKYSITYDDNVVTNMPVDSSNKTHSSTIPLPNITPKRTGYKFLGWCNSIPTTTNGTDSCTGTIYNPNGDGTNLTYTLDQTGGPNTLSLTAMWKELCPGYTKMQDMTATSAAALLPNVGSTATVCDTRDEQTYTIAKLKDNKYWMAENLNLAGGTKLSSDTTDFEPTYSLPTNQGWKSDGSLPDSSKSGFDNDNYAYVYNSGNKTNNCADPGCYSYYSWDAATLGSGRNISTDNTDAPYSICPKGWRLPTSGSDSNNGWKRGDFYKLATAYGANLESNYYDGSSATGSNFYNNAGPNTVPNFLLSGYYLNGSFYYGGSNGRYWSATSYGSSTLARDLYFASGAVSSADPNARRYGFAVRCILKAEQ